MLGRLGRRGRLRVPRAAFPMRFSESFLGGSNSLYIDSMYEKFKADPSQVHASWQAYFTTGEYAAPPSLGHVGAAGPSLGSSVGAGAGASPQQIEDTTRIIQMIRSFQVEGHYQADIDPLGLLTRGGGSRVTPELEPEYWGWTEADLDREVVVPSIRSLDGFLAGSKTTIREIHRRLKEVYCGHVGVEYMHIADNDRCNWIRTQVETPSQPVESAEHKIKILDRFMWADRFEKFIALKFGKTKRFGIDGAESMIPALKEIIDHAATEGVESVVLGMAHRGRLNVLSTVMRKPLKQIFHEFQVSTGQTETEDETLGSGDVKYHMGYSVDRQTIDGHNIHLSLAPNPSHLEAVNPVVFGKVKAKMHYAGDKDGSRHMPLIIHGDAAFAGQGVNWECFAMKDLKNYHVGGTIHFVCNNQIGFTTDPSNARSSAYCTDIARAVDAPIFHVNGDDPLAVVRVAKMATAYRNKFKSDVVVDLVCYRRFGHNEGDEPKFTQPLLYRTIDQHTPVIDKYKQELLDAGVVTQETITQMETRIDEIMESSFEKAKTWTPPPEGDWLAAQWGNMKGFRDKVQRHATGCDREILQKVGKLITTVPENFSIHRRINNFVLKPWRKAMESGEGINWGLAENLAYGSLLAEGTHVRVSGQDVERGTFSHRHAVWHDQDTVEVDDELYVPLTNLGGDAAQFTISNSHLSEFAVLGFENGYASENPKSMVVWEAQFGDFANGATTIFDQFISAGEEKWLRQSGLVVLLPHGFEGAGPEHSSCRLERFLQMSNDDAYSIPDMSSAGRTQIRDTNWQVCNVTTPANMFHLLRRQIHREFRKPLIVATPKSLLKHAKCVSSLDEFVGTTRFQRFLPDDDSALTVGPKKVRKLLLCTGKVYYDLIAERETREAGDIAISRIEQIAPFPFDKIQEQAEKYPNAEIVWVQEEPQNMGAWTYVDPRIETALRDSRKIRPSFAGRPPCASPATGSLPKHKKEINDLLAKAFA